MAIEYIDCLYDKKTQRPAWSGSVSITHNNFAMSQTLSGARKSKTKTTISPKSITAIIVPVGTSNPKRTTPNILGYDNAREDKDKGHLMAFSLGAPFSERIMFPQNRQQNQNLADGQYTETSTVSELSWRGMEIFAAALANYGLTNSLMAPPFPDDEIEIFPNKKVYWRGANISKRNILAIKDYKSDSGKIKPKFKLKYHGEIVYDYRRRINHINVKIEFISKDFNLVIINKDYPWTIKENTHSKFNENKRAAQANSFDNKKIKDLKSVVFKKRLRSGGAPNPRLTKRPRFAK